MCLFNLLDFRLIYLHRLKMKTELCIFANINMQQKNIRCLYIVHSWPHCVIVCMGILNNGHSDRKSHFNTCISIENVFCLKTQNVPVRKTNIWFERFSLELNTQPQQPISTSNSEKKMDDGTRKTNDRLIVNIHRIKTKAYRQFSVGCLFSIFIFSLLLFLFSSSSIYSVAVLYWNC